jgi:hypothetical protein
MCNDHKRIKRVGISQEEYKGDFGPAILSNIAFLEFKKIKHPRPVCKQKGWGTSYAFEPYLYSFQLFNKPSS